jgi:hypothetical protein
MAVDFPDGLGDDSAYAVGLTATEVGLGDDLSAVSRSLKYISTWLTWSASKQHPVPDVDSDEISSNILALTQTALSLGLIGSAAGRAPGDSDFLVRLGSSVEELVNIPGVLAFTTASEAIAAAAAASKGPAELPPTAPPPRPPRSSKRPPPRPIPAKLTAA